MPRVQAKEMQEDWQQEPVLVKREPEVLVQELQEAMQAQAQVLMRQTC